MHSRVRFAAFSGLCALFATACALDDGRRATDTFGDDEADTGTAGSSDEVGDSEGESSSDGTEETSSTDSTGDSESTSTEDTGPGAVGVQLSVSANAAALGDGLTLSWVSSNAVACTPLGGNAAWQGSDPTPLTNGSLDLVMDTVGGLTFGLECEGAGGDTELSEASVEVACPPPEVPQGEVTPWVQYWEQIWPEQNVFQTQQALDADAYFSLSFATGEVVGHGEIQTIQLTNGLRNVAVSQCPGVFMGAGGPSEDNPCFERHANGQSLSYSTDGTTPCNLNPNQTYYLNITYVDVERNSGDYSYCSMASCQFNLNSAWAP